MTITSTADSATDLGYLLHKHPERVASLDVAVGRAFVFYPEATDERCTVALLLEVDPIGLVRNKRFGGAEGFSLAQYVNDRPYAASSMFAVALQRAFKTAISGRCDARPELVDKVLSLAIHVPALPTTGGPELVERLFTPLGWNVSAETVPLDPEIPAWGDSKYVNLTLAGNMRLVDALNHLYVLLPVLDNSKHYWVSSDEVDKLVRAGEGWLGEHPDRELITRRYLAHQKTLVASAIGRLAEVDDTAPEMLDNAIDESAETDEPRKALHEYRREAVLTALRDVHASRVVDMGCGEGALLRPLLADASFTEVVGVDVSHRALAAAERRLNLDRMGDRQRDRLQLLQSSVTYRDDRFAGYDAVVLMEVIEHVDDSRLQALERTVFADARPQTVIVTTPNSEYNALYGSLLANGMRHPDHRFEWTREQFQSWADAVAERHGYTVTFRPVGETDAQYGAPTQLALFRQSSAVDGGVN
jgi:3' terminal RNA ribose 2'-O-methyltransferase Hen1